MPKKKLKATRPKSTPKGKSKPKSSKKTEMEKVITSEVVGNGSEY